MRLGHINIAIQRDGLRGIVSINITANRHCRSCLQDGFREVVTVEELAELARELTEEAAKPRFFAIDGTTNTGI